MAPRRKIQKRYGTIEVYEKSLIVNNHTIFLREDPETLHGLIDGIMIALKRSYQQGKSDKTEQIQTKYKELIQAMRNPNAT